MGPMSADDQLRDGTVIAENLMENILNEALRSVNERSDCYGFDSFESLKLQAFGSEDILEFTCPRKDSYEQPIERKSPESEEINAFVSDVCYPSLANLPEVCIHTSSVSNTSKQGEGDFQHPKIREAEAFYRLDTELDEAIPCGSKDYCKNSPNSSLITETSHNELIANLQKEMDLSFDNITLSDVEADCESSQICDPNVPSSNFSPRLAENMKVFNSICHQKEYDGMKFQNSEEQRLGDQEVNQNRDDFDNLKVDFDVNQQSLVGHDENYDFDHVKFRNPTVMMQQSQKFCQLHSNEYFPHTVIPKHYDSLVNENIPYICMPDLRDDEQELLSENSEELVIVETEHDKVNLIDLVENGVSDYSFQNSLHASVKPSVMILGKPCSPEISEKDKKECKPTSIKQAEPTRELNSWEEDVEVQVNIFEPSKNTERENCEDEKVFQSREYWSNVGIVTEHTINPRFQGLVENPFGIESMKGLPRVTETVLKRGSQRLWEMNNNEPVKNELFEVQLNEDFEKENIENCTSTTIKNVKGKKKKGLVARMSESFNNLFRSKKKNPKS